MLDETAREAAPRALHGEAVAFVARQAPEVRDFAGAVPDAPAFRPVAATPLAPLADLAGIARRASAETAALARAIVAAAPFLDWRHGYDEAQVGADYLARSGWCEIAGPEGPLVVPGSRMFVGCWGGGLDHPFHWHRAAEVYLPVAGRALFRADGREERMAGPGDAVFHDADQRHATTFGATGFLALILWRGPDLAVELGMERRDASP